MGKKRPFVNFKKAEPYSFQSSTAQEGSPFFGIQLMAISDGSDIRNGDSVNLGYSK
jgi:hypothetical protein